MANVRPKVDAVIVGLGWCGSLIAEELTRAGLNVIAIERGPWFETATDFPPSVDTDELRWDTRRSMLLPPAIETTTFRNNRSQPESVRFECGGPPGGPGHARGADDKGGGLEVILGAGVADQRQRHDGCCRDDAFSAS